MNKVKNNIKIINQTEQVKKGKSTIFLEGNERNIVKGILKKESIRFKEFIPFKEAEKVIYYNELNPEVVCFKIIGDKLFTHSQILGTLFSHQIDTSVFGDIIIYNNENYILVLKKMSDYFIDNIKMIGNDLIKLEIVPVNTIEDFRYELEEMTILISSNRLDNVVSSIAHTSRKYADKWLDSEYVRVNYETVSKASYKVKIGDILSIRKIGKFKISTIETTKGEKLKLTVLKFI